MTSRNCLSTRTEELCHVRQLSQHRQPCRAVFNISLATYPFGRGEQILPSHPLEDKHIDTGLVFPIFYENRLAFWRVCPPWTMYSHTYDTDVSTDLIMIIKFFEQFIEHYPMTLGAKKHMIIMYMTIEVARKQDKITRYRPFGNDSSSKVLQSRVDGSRRLHKSIIASD